MNLQQYLNQEPATVAWGLEDDISLEQYIGTLNVLSERYDQLTSSLEEYNFMVDVARHHPDSPAFEGLGIEARSILSVTMEDSDGDGWVKKIWEVIKNAAVRLYQAIRDFFGKLFGGYKALGTKMKEVREELNKVDFKDTVKVKVANIATIQVKGGANISDLKEGAGNNKTLATFFAENYIDIATTHYESFVNQESKLTSIKNEEGLETNARDTLKRFSDALEKSPLYRDAQNGFPIMGDVEFRMAKLQEATYKLYTMPNFKRLESKQRTATDIEIKSNDKTSLLDIISDCEDAIEIAQKSEKKSKELNETRKKVLDRYTKAVDGGVFAKFTDRGKVNFFLKSANKDLTTNLQQFHTYNYRSCRGILGFANQVLQAQK